MTPYEYLCEQLLLKRIKAHIYEQLDKKYKESYCDTIDGLHDDLKNTIAGSTFSDGAIYHVHDCISQCCYQYVWDGNLLAYDEDIQAFLTSLGIGETFVLPINIETPIDFYYALIGSVLYDIYSGYLKANEMKFAYRLRYQGEEEGISKRYIIELKKW